MMSSASGEPQLELARCVVRPADGSYQFHASLLSTIPEWQSSAPTAALIYPSIFCHPNPEIICEILDYNP